MSCSYVIFYFNAFYLRVQSGCVIVPTLSLFPEIWLNTRRNAIFSASQYPYFGSVTYYRPVLGLIEGLPQSAFYELIVLFILTNAQSESSIQHVKEYIKIDPGADRHIVELYFCAIGQPIQAIPPNTTPQKRNITKVLRATFVNTIGTDTHQSCCFDDHRTVVSDFTQLLKLSYLWATKGVALATGFSDSTSTRDASYSPSNNWVNSVIAGVALQAVNLNVRGTVNFEEDILSCYSRHEDQLISNSKEVADLLVTSDNICTAQQKILTTTTKERFYHVSTEQILMQREELLRYREQQLQNQLKTLEHLHRELQISENRWSYALQGNGDAVWDWNIKKDEIFLSYRFYEMLGYHNMNGKRSFTSVLNSIHVNYQAAFEAEVFFCSASPFPPLIKEILIENSEKGYTWVMVRGKVVEVDEATGEALRMVGTMTDLSSIKLMKRELSIYEEMIKQNQTAILLTDLDGHIEFINDTAGQLLDYHDAEILYHKLNILDTGQLPFSEVLVGEVRQSGGWSDEVLLKRGGEQEIETQVTASLLHDEHNEPYGIVINIKDISERIKLERNIAKLEKEKLAAELDHQRQFTEMMIQVQENEKMKLAKELHDGVGQMLNLIKLHVESAQTNDPAVLHQDLDKIKELLIQTLRDVKSITHELTPLSLQQLGLKNALVAMMNGYQEAVQEKTRFLLKIDINENEAPITDTLARHIYRIVQESVTNAIKYAQADTISLILIVLKNKLHLLLEDNGIGFQYEEQIQKSHSFGLKNIEERAKLLGGRLLVDASPGQGCTISLTIPLGVSDTHAKSEKYENKSRISR